MKSVTRLKGASHVNEFSETSPLLSKHDSTSDTATNGGTRIDSCVEEPIYPQTKSECISYITGIVYKYLINM